MSAKRSQQALIVFTKAPSICRVKTRFYPNLSYRECLYLHRQSVQRLLQSLSSTSYRIVIYSTEHSSRHLPMRGVPIKQQQGLDLGIKMFNAITNELKNSKRVVLIGTDCLAMDDIYIEKAFSQLQSDRDIVIGPANDGGYVLIGASKAYHNLFKNIVWGSDDVLANTLQRAKNLGVVTHLLAEMIDVDEKDDLLAMANNNALPAWATSLLLTH